MISKPVGVCVALAAMFAISGCNQTTPSANIAPSASNPAAPSAPPAESQAAAPSGSVRSLGPAEKARLEVGEVVDDATITTKVKAALLQAPDVKGLDVKVETDKAVVQLSGFVASQAQIDKAVELAKSISGVREVQNKMSVKPS